MSTQTIAEANQAYFDKIAADYNMKDWQIKMTAETSAFIQRNLEFLGVEWATPEENGARQVRLLDYACGTGTVSKALGSHVTECRGLDISSTMVERYNEVAASGGFKPVPARATRGDLLVADATQEPSLNTSDLFGFDIAAVGLGFHHFADHILSIKRLAERVKPGGVVLIIDVGLDGGWDMCHEAAHTVTKHGFSEQDMKDIFHAAGLTDFGFVIMDEPLEIKMTQTVYKKVFLARARRPA